MIIAICVICEIDLLISRTVDIELLELSMTYLRSICNTDSIIIVMMRLISLIVLLVIISL
jgi:hypothetical protein